MRKLRLALAAVLAALAAVLVLGAHDLLAWRSSIAHGDTLLRTHPAYAHWLPAAWLPGDPVRPLLALDDDLALRRAVRAYDVAIATPRGYDSGDTQTRVRSAAEVRLSDVSAESDARAASQAGDLLGVLVARGGSIAGGVTPDDRAAQAFAAAVQRDPANVDAKYNLELVLRRARARATRRGPGNGSGTRGRGHGAAAGTPGRGY